MRRILTARDGQTVEARTAVEDVCFVTAFPQFEATDVRVGLDVACLGARSQADHQQKTRPLIAHAVGDLPLAAEDAEWHRAAVVDPRERRQWAPLRRLRDAE